MANITIKELLPSDTISQIVDKINFNFDQLLLNGGGPQGPIGLPGPQGPIGPQGTFWFTMYDLWTTPLSPEWANNPFPQRVNIISNGNYKGDPNRYQPSIYAVINPERTYTFHTTLKPVRKGDLYLQEGDDNYNNNINYNEQSYDGDVWEYNGSYWVKTGVNIKGEQGIQGQDAINEWERFNDNNNFNTLIRPATPIGYNPTRIFLSDNSTLNSSNIFDYDNLGAILTISADSTHIALNNPNLHVNSDNINGAQISVDNNGNLYILGSVVGSSKQIHIIAFNSDIILSASNGNIEYIQKYEQSNNNFIHKFYGGGIEIDYPINTSLQYIQFKAPVNNNDFYILRQNFNINDSKINIYASYISSNNLSNPHIIFQNDSLSGNVGIGNFPSGTYPGSKLSIKNNLSVGDTFAAYTAPLNSVIVEGKVLIGNNTLMAVNGTYQLQIYKLFDLINNIGDNINIGTFDNLSINSLNIDTHPVGSSASSYNPHTETNIKGSGYIGFNAYVVLDPSDYKVVYQSHPEGGYAGAIIFIDRNGNIHFANYEEVQQNIGGGGSGWDNPTQ